MKCNKLFGIPLLKRVFYLSPLPWVEGKKSKIKQNKQNGTKPSRIKYPCLLPVAIWMFDAVEKFLIFPVYLYYKTFSLLNLVMGLKNSFLKD